MKELVLAADRRLTGLAMHLACGLLAVVSLLGLWQVLTRFVLSQPSSWTEELMRRLLVWCVMLGVVVAFRQGSLVSVDLMLQLSRGAFQRFVRGLILVVSLAFLAVIVRYGVDLAWRVRFQTFASMELSMAWAYAALPVGALMSMLAVVAHHLDPRPEERESAR